MMCKTESDGEHPLSAVGPATRNKASRTVKKGKKKKKKKTVKDNSKQLSAASSSWSVETD